MAKNNPTPTRGVPVTLADGKERRLRYTLRAMREMRETIPAESLEKGIEIDHLPEALRIGLAHASPEITTEEIEELVDGENMEHVMRAFIQAFMGKRQSEDGAGKATGGASRAKKSKKKS